MRPSARNDPASKGQPRPDARDAAQQQLVQEPHSAVRAFRGAPEVEP